MKQMMGQQANLTAATRKPAEQNTAWLSAIGHAQSASAIGYRLLAI
jgi:hypothetical protein